MLHDVQLSYWPGDGGLMGTSLSRSECLVVSHEYFEPVCVLRRGLKISRLLLPS